MLGRLIERYFAKRMPYPSRNEIAKEVREKHLAAAKEIAARYTRGNVAIQRGDMILKEDLGAPGAKRPRSQCPFENEGLQISGVVIHDFHVDTNNARPHGRDRAEDEALSDRSHR